MCFLYGDHLADDNPTLRTIRRRRELSLEQWKAVLTELLAWGVRQVVMTGGEVFLKREFLDLVAHAKALGFTIGILSNGALIADELAARLVEIGPWMVRFSLDGDRETHDAICGVQNFDLLMASIRRIRREQGRQGLSRPELRFETVIQHANQNKLHHVVETAREHGIRHILMSNIFFTSVGGNASGETTEAWQPTRGIQRKLYEVDVDVLDRELRTVRALAAEQGIELQCRIRTREDIERIYHDPAYSYADKCLYPWMMCRINPYGDVIPCTGSSLSMGNVTEESLRDIWNGEPYREFRRRLRGCGLFPECLKCNTLEGEASRVWNRLPRWPWWSA